MILLQQMIILFLIMVLGFFLAKKDILDPVTSKKMSWVVVNVCNPAMILNSALGKDRVPEDLMVQTLWVALLMYGVLLVVGTLMPFLLRKKECKSYSIMTVFANIGFMGIPLIKAMYGDGAVMFATIFNMLYSLLMYTYGIMMISGEKLSLSNLKKIVNVGVITCIIAITLYLCKVSCPKYVVDGIGMISGMTAPLSMMIIGSTFVGLTVKSLLGDVRLLVFTLLRLVVFPLAFFPVMKLLVSDPTLLGVCLIMITAPVGSMTVMIAQQYGGDTEVSSKGVALTTVLSVITMPVLSMILM